MQPKLGKITKTKGCCVRDDLVEIRPKKWYLKPLHVVLAENPYTIGIDNFIYFDKDSMGHLPPSMLRYFGQPAEYAKKTGYNFDKTWFEEKEVED